MRIISSTQILARVKVYLPPFISQILDLIGRIVLIFTLINFEWRDTENQQLRGITVDNAAMLLAAALKYEAVVRSEPRICFLKCHVNSPLELKLFRAWVLGVGVAGGFSTNCIWGGSVPSSKPPTHSSIATAWA